MPASASNSARPVTFPDMKQAAVFLISMILTAGCREADRFYVWQQHWNSRVLTAVKSEAATTLYPIVTEVARSGESALVHIPWTELAQTPHQWVPVIRVPLKAFSRPDIGDELARICDALDAFQEVQLDLDCPERRLAEYADLLRRLRPRIPQETLSVTALPAHLNNRMFKNVAAHCDYYVLQVHGLDVPVYMTDRAELMNPATARQAVRKAEALDHPYFIALPCYAYELNFDPASGKFLHLTAEGPAGKETTLKRRIAADPRDLIALIQNFQTLENARGIIWFRLPVEGDQLCLPRPALADIQAGRIPASGISYTLQAVSETTAELSLRNEHVIHAHEATLALAWPEPRGTYDIYRDISAPAKQPGRLPATLTVPVPPPGSEQKIGWFSFAHPPTIEITLK